MRRIIFRIIFIFFRNSHNFNFSKNSQLFYLFLQKSRECALRNYISTYSFTYVGYVEDAQARTEHSLRGGWEVTSKICLQSTSTVRSVGYSETRAKNVQ